MMDEKKSDEIKSDEIKRNDKEDLPTRRELPIAVAGLWSCQTFIKSNKEVLDYRFRSSI